MTGAQRYNARKDRIFDEARRLSPEIFGLNPIAKDERTVAERKWQAGLKPAKPQLPADVGLFSDESDQLEMTVEMFMPVNE